MARFSPFLSCAPTSPNNCFPGDSAVDKEFRENIISHKDIYRMIIWVCKNLIDNTTVYKKQGHIPSHWHPVATRRCINKICVQKFCRLPFYKGLQFEFGNLIFSLHQKTCITSNMFCTMCPYMSMIYLKLLFDILTHI